MPMLTILTAPQNLPLRAGALPKLLENFQIMTFDPQRDLVKARQLNKLAVLKSPIGPAWNESWNISLKHIKKAYTDNEGAFFVVYDGNRLIAMGGLQPCVGTAIKTAKLKKVRVHPDYRGLGLGEMLCRKREKTARKRGYKILQADIAKENLPMQRLLEKMGFLHIGERIEEGREFLVFEKRI